MTVLIGIAVVINLSVLAAYRHGRDQVNRAVGPPAGSHAKPSRGVHAIERRTA